METFGTIPPNVPLRFKNKQEHTEGLDCEIPGCDHPSQSDYTFDRGGHEWMIGTCKHHDHVEHALNALNHEIEQMAPVVNAAAMTKEKRYMYNSYEPEGYDYLDEAYQRPPRRITPATTKRAGKKGYDEADAENITRIVAHIRNFNVNRFKEELRKKTRNPTTDQIREYVKNANPTGYPKVKMGGQVRIIVGAHGSSKEAGVRAGTLSNHLLELGHETQPFVAKTPGEGGYSYGVIPVVSKVGATKMNEQLFSDEELARLEEKLDQMQEGTYHMVRGKKVWIAGEEDDSEPHRREYAAKQGSKPRNPREQKLAAMSGDPKKITKGDVLKARGVVEDFSDDDLDYIEEAKATYCGRCGTTHVKPSMGGKCPAMKEHVEPIDAYVAAIANNIKFTDL